MKIIGCLLLASSCIHVASRRLRAAGAEAAKPAADPMTPYNWMYGMNPLALQGANQMGMPMGGMPMMPYGMMPMGMPGFPSMPNGGMMPHPAGWGQMQGMHPGGMFGMNPYGMMNTAFMGGMAPGMMGGMGGGASGTGMPNTAGLQVPGVGYMNRNVSPLFFSSGFLEENRLFSFVAFPARRDRLLCTHNRGVLLSAAFPRGALTSKVPLISEWLSVSTCIIGRTLRK